MSNRRGLSIVEVMVALVLITIALLGMAGSVAIAVRQITDANGRRIAVHDARTRFGVLAAEGCLRATSGIRSDTVTGLREHWIVSSDARFGYVTDTIVWNSPRGARSLTVQSAFAC